MTAPDLEMTHPSEEDLAAFVDGRISDEPMVEHLADCADCRDIVMTATEMKALDSNVKQAAGRFGAGKFFWPLAAAAALGVMFFATPLKYEIVGPGPDVVVEAAEALPVRTTPGRFAGGFAHKPQKAINRGGAEDDETAAKAKLYNVALQNADAMFENARTTALTEFLTAEDFNALNAAVHRFEDALAKSKGRDRDLIENDLSAALLARGQWTSSMPDLQMALTHADAVWKRTNLPEAAWNRAMALEQLNRKAEAKVAWEAYLRLDPNSEWATEARGYLKNDAELGTLP